MKLKKLVTRMTPLLDEIVQRIKDTNDLKFLAPVEENCQNSVVVCLPLIPGSKIQSQDLLEPLLESNRTEIEKLDDFLLPDDSSSNSDSSSSIDWGDSSFPPEQLTIINNFPKEASSLNEESLSIESSCCQENTKKLNKFLPLNCEFSKEGQENNKDFM